MALRDTRYAANMWDEDIYGQAISNARQTPSLSGTQTWGPIEGLKQNTDWLKTAKVGDADYLAKMQNQSDSPWSKLFTKGGMEGFGSAMSGLGSLATGWAALKNLKLTRQAMDTQQNQWSTNYEAQRLATNNQIANQNAWKQAQGRTDYGSYVGGKPSGTTYVG